MIHPETHAVTPENGPRPAGPPDRCFYCLSAVGENHTPDCVCCNRTVVISATIEYVLASIEVLREAMEEDEIKCGLKGDSDAE